MNASSPRTWPDLSIAERCDIRQSAETVLSYYGRLSVRHGSESFLRETLRDLAPCPEPRAREASDLLSKELLSRGLDPW